MQFKDRFGYTHLEERCWTGVQYDASIASVNRKQEIVYLQAEGLAPLFMGDPSNMVVNAIIPMKHNSLEAQRMALVKVSYELLQVCSCFTNMLSECVLERLFASTSCNPLLLGRHFSSLVAYAKAHTARLQSERRRAEEDWECRRSCASYSQQRLDTADTLS